MNRAKRYAEQAAREKEEDFLRFKRSWMYRINRIMCFVYLAITIIIVIDYSWSAEKKYELTGYLRNDTDITQTYLQLNDGTGNREVLIEDFMKITILKSREVIVNESKISGIIHSIKIQLPTEELEVTNHWSAHGSLPFMIFVFGFPALSLLFVGKNPDFMGLVYITTFFPIVVSVVKVILFFNHP